MREGWVIGVVQQSTFEFGEEGMRAAISLAKGEQVDEEIPIDVSIVTPDNLEDFEFYLED
jgi:ABC-type sugar transport system substrate-binding protein